jgi:predicted PurR-regulated permease PerM
MNSSASTKDMYRRGFIVVVTLGLLVTFFILIRNLFVTVTLAAIFSSLLFPFQGKLERAFKGRRTLAAVILLGVSILVVGIPLLGLLAVAAREAMQVAETAGPWLKDQMNKPMDQWVVILEKVPFYEELRGYQANIIDGISKLLQSVGASMTGMLTAATTQTVDFFFKAFVAVYSAFFFLTGGKQMYSTVTGYLPLTKQEVGEITDKMLLLIRATIKSLFIIGAIQGALISVAFFFLGIKASVFWGIVAAALSALPGVGASLVWIPAVIYLIAIDRLWAGIVLALWGVLVVGLVDNFLRPVIIGKDTRIPELLIFFAMLGGLSLFGIAGFILGPVVVSLLISVLEIYQKSFRQSLPK